MNLKKSLLVASLALTGLANAQEFSLTGEFRPRTELFGNGFNYKYQPAAGGGNTSGREGTSGYINTSVRAALNAKYTSDSYTTYIGIQEVFNFGDRQQIAATGNTNFRVQEAWADIKLGETTSLKIGRQPLSYDDQRILGGLGWAQQARTHDAAIFKYSNDGYNLDLGGSLSNTGADAIYDTSAFFTYRDMAFIHANKAYGDLNISALGLLTTQQDLDVIGSDAKATLLTAGLHADYKLDIVKLSANAYLQNGQRIFGAVQDVENAYLASLDATVKASDNLTVLAGGEVISGTTNDSAAFFPLYGTNHKFNGLMDRFYVGNHAVGNGLVDLNLGLQTKLAGAAITLKAHNFAEESASGNTLGQEIDLVVAKQFKGYKLVGGYSQFFESDDYPNPAGNNVAKDTQNWAWLMLIIKPKFL